MKVSRPVLRGRRRRKALLLPDWSEIWAVITAEVRTMGLIDVCEAL
jgi:hypothetical protein